MMLLVEKINLLTQARQKLLDATAVLSATAAPELLAARTAMNSALSRLRAIHRTILETTGQSG